MSAPFRVLHEDNRYGGDEPYIVIGLVTGETFLCACEPAWAWATIKAGEGLLCCTEQSEECVWFAPQHVAYIRDAVTAPSGESVRAWEQPR